MLSTVEKAGKVLRLFTAASPEWGVTEVARALNISKTSAHDALTTLTHIGLVHRMVTGRYRLGFMVVSLHAVLMAQTPWRHVAREEMERLAASLTENVHLIAFDGGQAICIEVVNGGSAPSSVSVGDVLPPHASASGKVVLAYRSDEEVQRACEQMQPLTPNTIISYDEFHSELARVRERGYALDIEELNLGRCAVAAPVRNANGEIIAALTISAATAHFERHKALWLAELPQAAKVISERLGYQPSLMAEGLRWYLIRGEEKLTRT
ncbi:IclR family transcriptional regulator [Deinococcus sp. YIM 77859]|uniref:IclR family transcriptional regulator n=1 Tax=Deinococcus sp. YIM 77859 TaxID=1540221 RepID=UPI0006901799|nr:IclR family transcriptional regulator [Deinococcus sp. YIM 77859]